MRVFVSVSVLARNIKTEYKIEKTKSKKIGRLRKGAENL